jgi:hypothetical protein
MCRFWADYIVILSMTTVERADEVCMAACHHNAE